MVKKKNSIPTGAIRIHLYPCGNVLKPRGSMEKESLGLAIYERLTSTFENWSNPDYGDNPRPDELLKQLKKNLFSEVDAAWKKFETEIRR